MEQPNNGLERPNEQSTLQALLTESLGDEEQSSSWEVLQVGDAGYIVQPSNLTLTSRDVVLKDFDDSLVSTSAAKTKHLELYVSFLQNKGIEISPEEAKRIMSITDSFSRWEDGTGKNLSYHVEAHLTALTWATHEIQNKIQDVAIEDRSVAATRAVGEVERTLQRIKEPAVDSVRQELDPFYFHSSPTGEKKLVSSREANYGHTEELVELFDEAFINLEEYPAVREAAETIKDIANLYILSYGDPHFQLRKIMHFFKKHPNFPRNSIMLTKVAKGDYIQAMMNLGLTSRTAGDPFGNYEHAVVLFDDDPEQIKSVMDHRDKIEGQGIKLGCLLPRREGIKTSNKKNECGCREIPLVEGSHNATDVVASITAVIDEVKTPVLEPVR